MLRLHPLSAPFALAIMAMTPLALPAQTEPLERVEALIEAGDYDRARTELAGWWEGDGPSDRRLLQHGIWLRGLLTVDGEMALRDYRRLAVEFPGGPWSGRALARLGQAAFAADDLPTAAEAFRTLVRDYPSSSEALAARDWLQRWGPAADRQGEAARSAPPSSDPVTLALDRSNREAEASVAAPFTVQLGAFGRPESARSLADRAGEAGFEVRLVRISGSGLIRVRSGRFPDEAAARRHMDRLRGRGFDVAMAEDAGAEEPYR